MLKVCIVAKLTEMALVHEQTKSTGANEKISLLNLKMLLKDKLEKGFYIETQII